MCQKLGNGPRVGKCPAPGAGSAKFANAPQWPGEGLGAGGTD